jgi:hypothetical protein
MAPRALLLALSLSLSLVAADASAFCGFYVSGADTTLYNNATEVVLMRDGVRTVLSMANNYEGPPEEFAMVVPVPVVLKKENVKTLPNAIFDRIDKLAAPRLVEYWEQDPCVIPKPEPPPAPMEAAAPETTSMGDRAPRHYGVKIEAAFSVGEYDVLVLSANDSLGLDAFLRSRRYKIPAGAEPYLRPYVAGGSKFFVAKVDVKKIRFVNGQATLSPLRFHYDSETFSLPVRLGLINAKGTQDLIVHVLGRSRFEVANYQNYAIPTNVDVNESVKDNFGSFYAALFDHVTSRHPRSVVTEYAWDAGSCDPCPDPPLEPSEIATLGADVLPAVEDAVGSGEVPPSFVSNLTLTRLHVRYGKDSLGEDLVFRAAPPIEGGRGEPGPEGQLSRQVTTSSSNNFQGRYVIRHPWKGPVDCPNPRRGIWGGPWQQVASDGKVKVATDTAFAPRGKDLAGMMVTRVPELENDSSKLQSGPFEAPPWPKIEGRGCASCTLAAGDGHLPASALAVAALAALVARRRSRRAQ